MPLKGNQLLNQYTDKYTDKFEFILNETHLNNTLNSDQNDHYFSDDVSDIFSTMNIIVSLFKSPRKTLVKDPNDSKSVVLQIMA